MINEFRAVNFRGFRDLTLRNLKTINVVVGRSGAGKTSFFEALRIGLAGTPNVAWNVIAQRGLMQGIPANPNRKQFEAGWSSLFPEFDVNKKILLSFIDSHRVSKFCDIYFDATQAIAPVFPIQPNMPTLSEPIYPLVFERRTESQQSNQVSVGLQVVNYPQIFGGFQVQQNSSFQMLMESASELGPACEIFHANHQFNTQLCAQQFSELRIVGKEIAIVETIRSLFTDVVGISSETPSNGLTSLYASTKHSNIKIPLNLYSAGITKFVSILVEIQNRNNSVIIVDEIENGIWYGIMPELWSALHRFAVVNNNQLFLSTHSNECLCAASSTISKFADDFALVQMAYGVDGNSARTAAGEDFLAAIETNIELRK